MAGTPGTPLLRKLGIKAGHKVCLLNAPFSFERSLASDEVRITHDLRLPLVDVAMLFIDSLEELERRFTDVVGRLHPAGGFWVAFPRGARRGSDITEEVIRRIAMAVGMTSSKVCVINAGWAGVRLVMRDEIRMAMAYRAEPPMISRRVRRPTARIAPRIARSPSGAAGAGSTLRRVRARSTK